MPNLPEIGPLFTEEAKAYNNLEVLGIPRWLRHPQPGQPTGSVLFAVPSEAAAKAAKKGLYIAGKKAIIVNFREFTSTT